MAIWGLTLLVFSQTPVPCCPKGVDDPFFQDAAARITCQAFRSLEEQPPDPHTVGWCSWPAVTTCETRSRPELLGALANLLSHEIEAAVEVSWQNQRALLLIDQHRRINHEVCTALPQHRACTRGPWLDDKERHVRKAWKEVVAAPRKRVANRLIWWGFGPLALVVVALALAPGAFAASRRGRWALGLLVLIGSWPWASATIFLILDSVFPSRVNVIDLTNLAWGILSIPLGGALASGIGLLSAFTERRAGVGAATGLLLGLPLFGAIVALGPWPSPPVLQPESCGPIPQPVATASTPLKRVGLPVVPKASVPATPVPQKPTPFDVVTVGDWVEYSIESAQAFWSDQDSTTLMAGLQLVASSDETVTVEVRFRPVGAAPLHPMFSRPTALILRRAPGPLANAERGSNGLTPNPVGCIGAGRQWTCDCKDFDGRRVDSGLSSECAARAARELRLGAGLLKRHVEGPHFGGSSRLVVELVGFGNSPVPTDATLTTPAFGEGSSYRRLFTSGHDLSLEDYTLSTSQYLVRLEKKQWATARTESTQAITINGKRLGAGLTLVQELEPIEYVFRLVDEALTARWPRSPSTTTQTIQVGGRAVGCASFSYAADVGVERHDRLYASDPWSLEGAPLELRFQALRNTSGSSRTEVLDWR